MHQVLQKLKTLDLGTLPGATYIFTRFCSKKSYIFQENIQTENVRKTYKDMHVNQTVDFVKEKVNFFIGASINSFKF